MEGVRRWIGANPTPNAQKLHGKSVLKPEVKKPLLGPESDRSMELFIMQLLDPLVSEEEEAEYQGSVKPISSNRFSSLPDILTNAEICWMLRYSPRGKTWTSIKLPSELLRVSGLIAMTWRRRGSRCILREVKCSRSIRVAAVVHHGRLSNHEPGILAHDRVYIQCVCVVTMLSPAFSFAP
jgi:hypothetical protein